MPTRKSARLDRWTDRTLEKARSGDQYSGWLSGALFHRIEALLMLDQPEEAKTLARDSLALHDPSRSGMRIRFMNALDLLGEALLRLRRREEAVPVFRELLEFTRTRGGGPHFAELARTYRLLESLGCYEEAEALRREEIAAIRSQSDPDFRSDPRAKKHFMRHVEPRLLSELAALLKEQGRREEAGRLHAEAVEMARMIFGNGAPTWKVVQAYGGFLAEYGEGPEDEAALPELKATFPRLFPR